MLHSRARSFGRRTASAGLMIGTLLLGGVAAAMPAQAADDEAAVAPVDTPTLQVTADGWVHYDSALSDVGATGAATTVQGVRDDTGACTFTGSGSATAGDLATRYTEE